jgi:hypothetical protein
MISLEANDYLETNVFGIVNSVHPGKVLKSSVAGSATKVHNQYAYDAVAVSSVELFAVGRDNGANPNAPINDPAAFRAAPQAHAKRLNLERTEKHKQSGKSYKEVAAYDDSGIALETRTYPPGASVPETGTLPSDQTQGEDRDVYPSTADPYARSRYHHVARNAGERHRRDRCRQPCSERVDGDADQHGDRSGCWFGRRVLHDRRGDRDSDR